MVHVSDDSASSMTLETLDTKKLGDEKVEGVSTLPREVLGI